MASNPDQAPTEHEESGTTAEIKSTSGTSIADQQKTNGEAEGGAGAVSEGEVGAENKDTSQAQVGSTETGEQEKEALTEPPAQPAAPPANEKAPQETEKVEDTQPANSAEAADPQPAETNVEEGTAKKDPTETAETSEAVPANEEESSKELQAEKKPEPINTTESKPKTSESPPTTSKEKTASSRPDTSEVEGGGSGGDSGGVATSDGGGGGGGGGGESSTEGKEEKAGKKSGTREKRSRRKSRKAGNEGGGGSVPGLRRRTSRAESRGTRLSTISAGGAGGVASGRKYLEVFILSAFQPSDPDGSGYVQAPVFWQMLQSPALNLQLAPDELAQLQAVILPDQSGFIPYAEFASRSTDIIASLYTSQPPLEAHWVELTTPDGSGAVNYNKQTGEMMDKAESGIDVFAGVIEDLYKRTDSDKKGYVTWKMFAHLLQSTEMSPFLQEQDVKDMKEQFGAVVSGGKASYEQFYVLAKELLLRVYRAKDPSDSPWCKISSQEFGEVWFNKFSGETHRGLQTGDSREHEIAFINEAYAHVEEVNYELEQYKEQCRVLENQLAKSTEDQETFAAQLYETGNALDEANSEIIRKDNELDQLKLVITSKDQQADLLRAKLVDMEVLKTRLLETEQELQAARDTIANRDNSITERDTNIMSLQRQAEAATDDLKTAHGEMDARDSALAKLKHELSAEQKRVKEFEKTVPELEGKLATSKEQLESSKRSLDEKTSALVQTRKHLKNARERNMFLEKEMEKLEQTHDKLCSAESEIRTLKTFLTTKTALIEKHKKELKDVRLKVAELEEKDSRRAVILADVLEKTARQYQQQLGQAPPSGGGLSPRGKRRHADIQPPQLEEPRPYSAPAVPPEGQGPQGTEETDYHAHLAGMAKSFTTSSGGPVLAHSGVGGSLLRGVARAPKQQLRTKNRSRTVPKLPPIVKAAVKQHQQRGRSFIFPTSNDLKKENKLRDAMIIDHAPSNPNCTCELCRMNATVVGHASSRRPETGLTGMTAKSAGLPGYQGETDVRELALAEQLQVGQRVLVRMKRSEFDLEPAKLAGIIKYVGKVDSEFVDHRIYVGVKLDEAVGDTDGLVKNKRYFTCPSKHGKLVRITNVVAVLPHKSVFYKSLQEISKRSPYTTVQKKLSAQA